LAHTPEAVQAFKLKMIAGGAGPATQRRTLAVLSAVLRKAVELNRIATNPVATVRKPSAKRARLVHPLRPEIVESLIVQMPTERDALMVALMAYGGLRPGEAVALEGADIGERSMSISRALKLDGTGETKTGARRIVPIPRELARHLAGLPDGPLFVSRAGPWTTTTFRNWRRRVWQPAADAAGIGTLTITRDEAGRVTATSYTGARPYDLRHTCASTLLRDGTDPIRVASIMGHSPQVLFSTYAHVIAELPVSEEAA
jgi:integrase